MVSGGFDQCDRASSSMDRDMFHLCATREEADNITLLTRLLLHCAHTHAAGYHRDTDVLVLLIVFYLRLVKFE